MVVCLALGSFGPVVSQYCQPSDLVLYGLPAQAIAPIPGATQTAQCIAASELADSYLRGRYPLPLTAWGVDLTMKVSYVASYLLLAQRGYNPAAGADPLIKLRYDDAIRWFEGIQKQAVHPDVTSTPSPQNDPTYGLPQVHSSQPRGWGTNNSSGTPTIG